MILVDSGPLVALLRRWFEVDPSTEMPAKKLP